MSLSVSILISTHNPDPSLFERTLSSIATQTLDASEWNLIIVDNASAQPIRQSRNQGKNCRIIREERLGLTFGRLAGIEDSDGEILVFVDDDNVLAPDYLETAIGIFHSEERLGLAGGIIEPEWCDELPETWAFEFLPDLALRNFGDSARVGGGNANEVLPEFSPIGAGMVARRSALNNWIRQAENGSIISDRRGNLLTSCGDADIVLHALHAGWLVGYFPELKLTHLIPECRLRAEYLARLRHDAHKSWVQVLHKHGIVPWPPVAPWTIPLRKLRAYLRHRAWAGPAQYIRWQHACGYFDGRAAIYTQLKSGRRR